VATVTGVTAARAQEIEDNSITGATLVGNDLVFTTGDGTTINAGRVIPPAVTNWPVGCIFMHVSATNPASLLGGGTWVRWGKGRVPISLDEANPRWDAAEEVGGAESITLTVAQIPSHDHGANTGYQSHDHSHTGWTDVQGYHQHSTWDPAGSSDVANGSAVRYASRQSVFTGGTGEHSHNVGTDGASTNHYHGISAQGGSGSHDNMPPFIAVYMWKRTA
jgi:microcystin-dependent protein